MGEARNIIRNSFYAFFHSYQSFASIAALLVFPVSASTLLSQAFIISSPPALKLVSSRLRALFETAGFPVSSQLFSLLNLMLSQTIFASIFTLPFTLTVLNLAKASVVQITSEFPRRRQSPPPFSSLLRLYCPLLQTHLFNSFIILSANTAIFALLFILFNAADLLGLSSNNYSLLAICSIGAIMYSIVLANTLVICNLAMIVSAAENCSGYLPVLKACVLIRGRVATALSLALPTNMAMAAVEALFQYRVMKPYLLSDKFNPSIMWEAFTIAYIHSILIVLEIIIGCMFFKKCKSASSVNWDDGSYQFELEPEEKSEV